MKKNLVGLFQGGGKPLLLFFWGVGVEAVCQVYYWQEDYPFPPGFPPHDPVGVGMFHCYLDVAGS